MPLTTTLVQFLLTACTTVTLVLFLNLQKQPENKPKGCVQNPACNDKNLVWDDLTLVENTREEMSKVTLLQNRVRNVTLAWTPTRLNVLIVAYMRSGSSFVGQIFNQHPDVFYIYEPLEVLTALELNDTAVFSSMVAHLLQVIYSCRFQEYPLYASKISLGTFRLMSKVLSSGLCPANATPGKLRVCVNLDPQTLNQLCESHKHTVVKSIRIEDFSLVFNSLGFDIERPWHVLRVLHLVRDPRAMVTSRLSLNNTSIRSPWTAGFLRQRTRELCEQIWNNLEKGALGEEWSHSYHVIRYEDVAENSVAAAKELFGFTGIQESVDVFEWLRKNTNVAYETDNFSTTKNATISIHKWRWEVDFPTVQVVQQECANLMNVLGYKILENESEMTNLKRSLILKISQRQSVFITQNVHRAMRTYRKRAKMLRT